MLNGPSHGPMSISEEAYEAIKATVLGAGDDVRAPQIDGRALVREAIGFVGRVGMIGDEVLEDAFGDFRTFYITFAKIFSTAPAQVRPARRVSGSPTFIP